MEVLRDLHLLLLAEVLDLAVDLVVDLDFLELLALLSQLLCQGEALR